MTNSSQMSKEASQLANAFPELSAYGYYVLVDQLYYQIAPYDIQMEFGFNKLGNLKYAPVDNQIKVIVYRPDWHYEHSAFFAQDLDIVNHDYTNKIEPQIVKISEDLFELTFPALHRGQLFVIRDYNALYGIGMGSISDTLVALFNSTNAPAAAVLYDLNQALKSFPDNLQLQASKGVWELKEVDDKAQKVWKDVQKKLDQYNGRDDRAGKLVFADDVVHEIQYYLSLADNLPQQEEAQKILDEIDQFKNAKEEKAEESLPDKSLLPKNITVYESTEYTITWIEMGDDILLRFKGLPNEFDKKVLRHKKKIQNEATGAFILATDEVTGNNWNTFSYENDGWGGSRTFVYPPLINQQVDVYLEADYTSDTPDALYEDYCKQQEEK